MQILESDQALVEAFLMVEVKEFRYHPETTHEMVLKRYVDALNAEIEKVPAADYLVTENSRLLLHLTSMGKSALCFYLLHHLRVED